MTKEDKETQLIWKLKELPTAEGVAQLVEQKVLTAEEARSVVFRKQLKENDEVEALKDMVSTLQELVKDLLAQNYVKAPYTKVIEVPMRLKPYWSDYWTVTSGNTNGNATWSSTTGSDSTVYTLNIS